MSVVWEGEKRVPDKKRVFHFRATMENHRVVDSYIHRKSFAIRFTTSMGIRIPSVLFPTKGKLS